MSETIVQFLGSGDAFGSGGRLQTCLYVNSPAAHFLIDCGASSLSAMKRWGVSPSVVDAILVTHLHGDHFGGIPFFILEAQLVSKRQQPLILAGPPGVTSRIRDAQEVLFPGSSRIQQRFPIEFIEFKKGESIKIGPVEVTPYGVVHESGAPPFALRVAVDGKVISYSGDTEWTDQLIRAAEGADLFICEAYYLEKKVKFHLDYHTLMSHRSDLSCGKLVLTHMSDDLLKRSGSLDAEYAEDGKRFVL